MLIVNCGVPTMLIVNWVQQTMIMNPRRSDGGGAKGHAPQFLENTVILCFEMRSSNHVHCKP